MPEVALDTSVSPIIGTDRESKRFFAKLPRAAWLIALIAAAVHMFPYVRAVATTPPGWEATGILSISPDYMQYRVWMRQAVEEGPIISNRFTTEANQRYRPVPLYYILGHIAEATGTSPEWVYGWIGAAFAFLLSLLIFLCARYFLPTTRATWTAFVAIMVGGGLGGYFMYLRDMPWIHDTRLTQLLFVAPFRDERAELLDAFRGDYVFSALFDTHFLFLWLVSVAAILSFYAALKRYSPVGVAVAAIAFGAATIIHVYEGVTLLMIAGGVTVLCWAKGFLKRESVIVTAACAGAVAAVFLWVSVLVNGSGLPVPQWRGVPIFPTVLLLGFPVAWALVAWGLARYWRTAGLEEVCLLGWLLGCTTLTLSAPFYPWPDRGVLSMQIPLTIIAAAVWFPRYPRLRWQMIIVAVLLMGSSPAMELRSRWRGSAFDDALPHKFLGPQHREILTALRERASERDVLIAPNRDRLWLAPAFRGRHYAGHFFLTVDFERKDAEVKAFYKSPDTHSDFLRKHAARFLYVPASAEPDRFRSIASLVPVRENSVGTLFEYMGTRR